MKPLLQVFKSKDNAWDYHCTRCLCGGWDRTWSAAMDRALEHMQLHVNVGFSPPKG